MFKKQQQWFELWIDIKKISKYLLIALKYVSRVCLDTALDSEYRLNIDTLVKYHSVYIPLLCRLASFISACRGGKDAISC